LGRKGLKDYVVLDASTELNDLLYNDKFWFLAQARVLSNAGNLQEKLV